MKLARYALTGETSYISASIFLTSLSFENV